MSVFRNALLILIASYPFANAAAQSAVAAINGTADQGNTVSIENLDTGRTRELEVGKRGRFQFRALPPGFYDVVIRAPDGSIVKSQMVTLRVGTSAMVRQGPRND